MANLSAQARVNARLRYSPQREALQAAAQAANEQAASTVSAGRTEGQLGLRAVRAAKPQVAGIYDREQAEASAGKARLAGALAALSPGFQATAASETQAGAEKTARERTQAETALSTQEVAAKQAPAFAKTQATQQLGAALSKIFESLQGVGAQEGLATSSELGKLENQAEGRALTERGQNLGHQDSVETRAQKAQEHKETLAAKANPGEKPLGRKEINEASSTAAEIRQVAAEGGGTRAERISALREGRPEQTHENKKGEKVKLPKIPAFKQNAIMSAGLDWAEFGHLTRNTEARLRHEGYDPARLGIPLAPTPPKSPHEAAKRLADHIHRLF